MSKNKIVENCAVHEDCGSCEIRFKCFTAEEDSLARFRNIAITPRAAELIKQFDVPLPQEKWCTGCGNKFTDKSILISDFNYVGDGTFRFVLRIDYTCRSKGWWHSRFNNTYDRWSNVERWEESSRHEKEIWY